MKHLTRSLLAAVLLAGSLPGCGANFSHPECKRIYDQCVNTCAPRCEDDHLPVDVEASAVNTWNSECQVCTHNCRELAEGCEDRNSHRVSR